jgi:hypothetical protein
MTNLCEWLGIEKKSDDLLYESAVNTTLSELQSMMQRIEDLKSLSPHWSDPRQIDTVKIPQNVIGVYKIIHMPTDKVMSVGQGVVSSRRGRHVSVFKNKGIDIVSDSGATSPSTTGRHMYRFDSVLSNWWFSWCSIPDKFLVKCYEELLQKELNPQFNSIHMGGNN